MSVLKINRKSMILIWVLMAIGQASAFVGVPQFAAYFTVGVRWLVGNAKVGGKVWDVGEAEKSNADLKSVFGDKDSTSIVDQEEGEEEEEPPQQQDGSESREPDPSSAVNGAVGDPSADSPIIKALKALNATDSSEKDYDLEMVTGKMWDMNVGFSGLIPLNDIFSIGGFVKAGWANSEYKLGGSYKFGSSVSGAIGLAIGVTRFLEIRAGFGVCSHQFSYEASDDLKNNMDQVTSNAGKLTKQAETQDLGDQAGKFNDLTTVSDDYNKARTANAVLMHFVAEALFKMPISGALDFVVSLGMTNPTSKATFTKVGQGQTDVTVRPPVSVSFGVGLGYGF